MPKRLRTTGDQQDGNLDVAFGVGAHVSLQSVPVRPEVPEHVALIDLSAMTDPVDPSVGRGETLPKPPDLHSWGDVYSQRAGTISLQPQVHKRPTIARSERDRLFLRCHGDIPVVVLQGPGHGRAHRKPVR